MSAVQDTYEIDVIGDVLLVVLKGDPAANDAEPEDDVAESETLLDDAESVDTLIIQNMLALRMLEPQPDNESSSAFPRRHQAHSTRPVRLRVSSHRLLRCSPIFRELLDRYIGNPGAAYQTHYPIHIPIWNDDPAILALVLRILHDGDQVYEAEHEELRTIIPTAEANIDEVDLGTLAQVATLVEKYEMHIVVENSLNKWIDNLWDDMKEASVRDAICWMWIAWVFDLIDYFEKVTEYLVKNSTKSMEGDEDLQFLIPSNVLSKYNILADEREPS
jgi:hypothetical protein